MRYVAASIVILAGALSMGLGSTSESASARNDTATLGLVLVLGGAALLIYDFVKELRSGDKDRPK